MRIDRVNKMDSIYKANATKAIKGYAVASGKDSIDISSFGKDLQIAKQAINNAPDIRMEKVENLKRQIESGNYNIDAKEVASKLVDSYFDAKI